MGENRLNGLVLVNIRPEIIIKPLNKKGVVDVYTNKHPMRIQLLILCLHFVLKMCFIEYNKLNVMFLSNKYISIINYSSDI